MKQEFIERCRVSVTRARATGAGRPKKWADEKARNRAKARAYRDRRAASTKRNFGNAEGNRQQKQNQGRW
jgi:hypothetical protein